MSFLGLSTGFWLVALLVVIVVAVVFVDDWIDQR